MIRELFHHGITLGSDKWDPYFDVYEQYMNKFVGRSPVIVEIGVQGGGSIQLWRKYLGPTAKVIGIDIDPGVRQNEQYYDENTTIVIGDQGSPEFWDKFFVQYPVIDILLDDGGHTMSQQKVTFEKVFPHISKGGVFICEDTATSYYPTHGGALRGSTFIEYAKHLIDVIHVGHIRDDHNHSITPEQIKLCKDISSINFVESMIIFEKNGRKPYDRVFALNLDKLPHPTK